MNVYSKKTKEKRKVVNSLVAKLMRSYISRNCLHNQKAFTAVISIAGMVFTASIKAHS